MKKIEKFKLSKNQFTLIILASVFVLLLAAYLIISAVMAGIENESDPTDPPYYDASVGETLYLGNAVAYLPIENREILSVFVTSKEGDFLIKRWPDDNGSFMIWYDNDGDGNGEIAEYNPPIAGKENDFDYESLYAVATDDGIGSIYLLTYLCASLNSPVISERIALPKAVDEESTAKRNLILKNYGFEAGKTVGISFDYLDRDVENAVKDTHTVMLGGRALSGSGFYYMVDGRDYIYYTSSNYFEYATRGVSAFVKGTLVSGGLDGDSTYEPYLTPDFKEWVNTQHKKDENALIGPTVEAGSTVVAKGEIFELDPEKTGGYSVLSDKTLSFDLNALKDHPDFDSIVKALVGKEVGYDYSSSPIVITLTDREGEKRLISFSSDAPKTYVYTVTGIEAVLTDEGETSAPGTPVLNNSRIKITYTYSVNGEAVEGVYHGIVDLGENAAFRDALSGLAVGALSENVAVCVDYTKDTAYSVSRRLIVSS